jgi:hypothetical protein
VRRRLAALALFFLAPAGPAWAGDAAYRALTLAQLGSFPMDSAQSYDSPIDAWADSEKKKPAKPAPLKIPAWIQKLNGAKVRVSGYMMPIDIDDEGAVQSFTLVKSIMNCCFGLTPNVNETVMCDTPDDKKTRFYMNVPLNVYGTFKVEAVRESGYVVSLYELSVDKVEKVDKADPDSIPKPLR